MTRIFSASKEVLVSDGIPAEITNSPMLNAVKRIQDQDYITTSDQCATPSELDETYDEVRVPMRGH